MCTSGMCVFVAVCVHGTCSWCVYIPGVCTFLVCVCYWSMHVPGVCVSLVCACPWCVHVPDVCMLVVSVLLVYACLWRMRVPGVCVSLVCVCYSSMHVPGVCVCRQYVGPCAWQVRGSRLSHGCPTAGGSAPTLPRCCPMDVVSLCRFSLPAFLGVTGPS